MRSKAILLFTFLLTLTFVSFCSAQTNYAQLPGWWEGYHAYSRFIHGADPQIVFWDTDVTLNGSGTIRCEGPASLTNQWREVDLFADDDPFTLIAVSPGDNITFTGYCKTNPSTDESPGGLWEGGIIGIDLYRYAGGIHRLWEVGAGETPNFINKNYNTYTFVNYGQNWTRLECTFTIPSLEFTEDSEGNPLGGSYVCDSMVPWVCTDPPYNDAEAATAWFGDLQLYINEEAPEPTPTPSPSPTQAFFLPDQTSGLDGLIGAAAVIGVFILIIWPFVGNKIKEHF